MTEFGGQRDSGPSRRTLPLRDIVLLPLVVLLTTAIMIIAGEGIARFEWPQVESDACYGHKENCRSMMKTAEGPWVEYAFNECGNRNPEPCGDKPEGTLRIAVFGSSLAGGAYVPLQETFAARLSDILTQACGKKVEVQNHGGFGMPTIGSPQPVLELKPDLVVSVVLPLDIEHMPLNDPEQRTTDAAAPPHAHDLMTVAAGLKDVVAASRLMRLAQHHLFGDGERYSSVYLLYGDKADFMRQPLTPLWNARLDAFKAALEPMAAETRSRGIPLIIGFMPQRAQLLLMRRSVSPPLVPDLLTRSVGDIVEQSGATFVDFSRALIPLNDIDPIYYRVDGHPAAAGHALIADQLSERILRLPSSSPFSACTRTTETHAKASQ